MRLILKLLSLPLILVTWIVYAICRLFVIASGRAGGSGRSCVHGFYRFILQGRCHCRAVMAGDCVSDQSLRSADGDRLADGKDRRTELCATGLSRKLTNKIDFERGVSASRSFHLY